MDDFSLLDLYTDYLIASFEQVTSTGLSDLMGSYPSHDRISRMLGNRLFTQKDYWQLIKGLVRRVERSDGLIKIDDTLEEKPYSTENDIICWHYDHSKNRNIKGINVLNFLYQPSRSDSFSVPLAFEIVHKTEQFLDTKTKKIKRRSAISKNELMRRRLYWLHFSNKVQYQTILWDTWFSSNENFDFVHKTLKKTFIGAIKSNRTVALSLEEKKRGKWLTIAALTFDKDQTKEIWLKGLDFPLLIAKQVFINKDLSTGELYVVTNELNYTAPLILATYHQRWGVEVFHRSIKQNVGLEKSPTKMEVTQSNHIFAAMLAWVKLEILSKKEQVNHYAFKSKLYVSALKAAFEELQTVKSKLIQQQPSLAIAQMQTN